MEPCNIGSRPLTHRLGPLCTPHLGSRFKILFKRCIVHAQCEIIRFGVVRRLQKIRTGWISMATMATMATSFEDNRGPRLLTVRTTEKMSDPQMSIHKCVGINVQFSVEQDFQTAATQTHRNSSTVRRRNGAPLAREWKFDCVKELAVP